MTQTEQHDRPHTKPEGVLVLFTGDLGQGDTILLSALQVDIVKRSIYKPDNGSTQYTDDELMTCTDADRAYRKPLFSIRQATAMMARQMVSGVALVLHPDQPSEQCLPLSLTQAAVTIGRLGIDLDNKNYLDDDTLSGLYKKTWKPRFKKQAAAQPNPTAPYTDQNIRSGLLTPDRIKAGLDATIIGQEEAKLKVALAVYRQALAQRYNAVCVKEADFVPLHRTNLLLCGPSGSGKTAMIKKLGTILDRPVVIYDATTLTPAGYIGNSPVDMLRELLTKANGDPIKASNGIIFLDEWDKAFIGASGSKDVSRFKSVPSSYELLKMMDGAEYTFESNDGQSLVVNSANILFIMGGAFPNLDDIVRLRTEGPRRKNSRPLGFIDSQKPGPEPCPDNDLPDPTPDDLKAYGIPTEILGRISTICRLKKLDRDDLVNIMLHSDQSPLAEQRKFFHLHNITLDVPEQALQAIADAAVAKNLGARGLASILESVLAPVLFRHADNKKQLVLRLTPDCFTCGAEPECRPFRKPVRRILPPF